MTITALTRREMLGRAAKMGVVLMAAPGARFAWPASPAESGLVLDQIEGFATSATIYQDEVIMAVGTHDGPMLFARNLVHGSTWRIVTGPEAFPPGVYIRSLVSYRGRLLALGTNSVSLDTVEFVIEDDQSYVNPEDPDVRPFPPGTIIREERRSIEPLLAASTNLLEWQTVASTGVEHASFAGAFTVGDRLALIGESFESPTFSADSIGAVLVVSSDLTGWERLVLPEEAQPLHGHFPGVAGVPAGGGLVIVSDTRGTRLLETSDGLQWIESTLPGPESLQVMGVASVPDGIAVAGVDGDTIRAWIRSGSRWRELDVSADGHLFGLAAIGTDLLLLGADPDHTPLVVVEGSES